MHPELPGPVQGTGVLITGLLLLYYRGVFSENNWLHHVERSNQAATTLLTETSVPKISINLNDDFIPSYTYSKAYPLIHENPPLNCSESIYGTKFNMTALHSFMGAGNTWTRYLIQQATGFLTGSSFNDMALRKNGFPGEEMGPKRFNMTIATKSHNINDGQMESWMFNYIENKNNSNKCVIVVRNPFDTFMAEFTRMRTGGHTTGYNSLDADEPDAMSLMKYSLAFRTSGEAKSWYWNGAGLPEKSHEENFHKKKNKGFAGRWLRSYYNAYNFCTNQGTNKGNNTEKTALLVLYENLKRNKVSELQSVPCTLCMGCAQIAPQIPRMRCFRTHYK